MHKRRLEEGKPTEKALQQIKNIEAALEPMSTTYIPELYHNTMRAMAERPPLTVTQKKRNAKKRRISKASRKKNR